MIGFRIKGEDMAFFKTAARIIFEEGEGQLTKSPSVADLARFSLYIYSKAYIARRHMERQRRAEEEAKKTQEQELMTVSPEDVISEDV